MNTIDIIILIPLLLGFVFGLSKGFISEIISIAVIVVGIYGSKWLSPIMVSILTDVFKVSERLAVPLSFVVLFIAIAVALKIIAKSLNKLINSISLGGLNKLFGGIFGLIKYALIISLLLNVFQAIDAKAGLLKPELKASSILYTPLTNFAPELWDEVKEKTTAND